jgi:hypothetical protein
MYCFKVSIYYVSVGGLRASVYVNDWVVPVVKYCLFHLPGTCCLLS